MREAAPWLVANIDLIRSGGTVLDVACGYGRNAIYLAERGFRVHAVDRDQQALDTLPPTVTTERIDLETGTPSFGDGRFDAVVVFNYLYRPVMPALVQAVAPGGVLIYETFTAAQATRGRPTNPAFLLKEGELPLLAAPLRIIRSREGDFGGKFVASIVAKR